MNAAGKVCSVRCPGATVNSRYGTHRPVPAMSAERSSASYWSSMMDLESQSSRPMSLDLPSSTEPQVLKRRSSMECRERGVE